MTHSAERIAVRIHAAAEVDQSARLGDGTVVWACANVMAGVVTGRECSIGFGAEIGRWSLLGDQVRIGYGVFLPSRTRVGDRVFIGPNVTMCDDRQPRVNNPDYNAEPPMIEDDAVIGAGAIILPGIRIGRGAMVGAGAVVTRDVALGMTVVGNPARVVGQSAERVEQSVGL